jgi:hypothetical protein
MKAVVSSWNSYVITLTRSFLGLLPSLDLRSAICLLSSKVVSLRVSFCLCVVVLYVCVCVCVCVCVHVGGALQFLKGKTACWRLFC